MRVNENQWSCKERWQWWMIIKKEKIKDIDLSCNLLCKYRIKDNYWHDDDDDNSYCCCCYNYYYYSFKFPPVFGQSLILWQYKVLTEDALNYGTVLTVLRLWSGKWKKPEHWT